MNNLWFALPLIFPTAFGVYLLFAPMKKLLRDIAWMPFPWPREGNPGYVALQVFWRSIGAVALGSVAVILYILFLR